MNLTFRTFLIFKVQKFQKNILLLPQFLKFKRKKTQKGTSYAIIKFSDLSTIFELFVFSDILESNRDKIFEGKSVILTLHKSINNENVNLNRINVKKVIMLDDLLNKPLNCVRFDIKSQEEINILSKILNIKGNVQVEFNVLFQEKNTS